MIRRASLLLVLSTSAAAIGVHACTGDDPVFVGGTDGGGGDAPGTDDASGSEAGGACADGTDVDCGGSCANRCEPNKACKVDGDCATRSCKDGFCQVVSLGWRRGPAMAISVKVDGGGIPPYGRQYFCAFATSRVVEAIAGDAYDDGTTKTLSNSANTADFEASASPSLAYRDGSLSGLAPRKLSACAVGPNGKLYMFGGENDVATSRATWVRDAMPMTATWSNSSTPNDLSTEREDFAVALGSDNMLYAFGGLAGTKGAQTQTSVVEVFSVTNGWAAIGQTLPQPRNGLAAVAASDSLIYVFGGNFNGQPVKIVHSFDAKTKAFTLRADMPTARDHFGAVAAPDGRIYAIGGRALLGANGGTAAVEAFNPATNTWSTIASLPAPRVGHQAVVAPTGQIWVLGGGSDLIGTKLEADTMIYGPSVSLSSATVKPGATVDVTGIGFAANAAVKLHLDSKDSPVLASGTSSADGSLPVVPMTVPAGTGTGGHRIVAVDGLSRFPVNARITVE
jgi:hypothetical protein